MTIEEIISKAAQKYCQDNIPDLHLAISTAFEAGAKFTPWHSVADGDLPNETGDYLCGNASDYYAIGSFVKGDNHFYDPFSRYDDERLDWVKYWMEIPQPPKGEEARR